MCDSLLDWVRSFLTDRTQQIAYSDEINICCAAGAVWGPVRIRTGPAVVSSLCVYTAELGFVVARDGLNLHQYADDMQIYVNTSARDAEPLQQPSDVSLHVSSISRPD